MSETNSDQFQLGVNYIDDRVVSDPSTFDPATTASNNGEAWPVSPGRYRLVGARACPFAHRAIIVRRLLGLEKVISLGLCGPTHDWKSWTFDLYQDSVDPILGVGRLRDCFLRRRPDYTGGVTVPALVDVASKSVVTNDFQTMVPDFMTEWTEFHRPGTPDLYPEPLREEINAISARIFTAVNLGVYQCGLAGSQEVYEQAHATLFDTLDYLEEHLSTQRYLVGDSITLADVNLFASLVRFDVAYHGLFKCDRYKIAEKPNLWGYLRDLFRTPGFGDTTNFQQIRDHYYRVITELNPSGIVAIGPDSAGFYAPHDRDERFGGSPFGEGTAPAAPLKIDVLAGDEKGAFR